MGCDIGFEIVVHMHRGSGKSFFDIDDGRQLLEIDIDIVKRILGDVAALRDHDDDGFADMADPVLGQRHLAALVENNSSDRRRRHQQWPRLPVGAEIVGGIGRDHAGTLQRAGDINAPDAGMRDLAAQEGRMQHAGQFDIVDEQRLAGEELAVLIAFDRRAEKAGRHGAAVRIACAAAIMASTMFW